MRGSFILLTLTNLVTFTYSSSSASSNDLRQSGDELNSEGVSLASVSQDSNENGFELQDETVVDENIPEELVGRPIDEKLPYIHYNKIYEVDRANLKIFKGNLSSGNFGIVLKGSLKMADPKNDEDREKRLDVAVKKASSDWDEFLEKMTYDELKIMCAMRKHPNVLALVGALTKENNSVKQTYIILEFVEQGSLLDFLRHRQGNFTDLLAEASGYEVPNSQKRKIYAFNKRRKENSIIENDLDSICTSDLLSFAYQIANGMKYLATIPLVHRDLALRNILINSWKIIRIADFGLARQYKQNEYYKMQSKDVPLPVWHMAPELFDTENPKFSEKSDVWSYGVCLYEIFTLGEKPYEKYKKEVNNFDDLGQFLKHGGRLEQPKYCHPDVYSLMCRCWNDNPRIRSTFSRCFELFGEHLEKSASQLLKYIVERLKEEEKRQATLEDWVRKDTPE